MPPFARRLLAIFTQRLHLKAAALLFAVLLWAVVSAEELTEQVLPVRVALTLDSSVSLRGPLPDVRATIEARGRDLLKLWQNPPIVHRRIPADSPDSLLLEVRPQDVDIGDVDAKVRDIEPHSIPVKLDVTAERRVPVHSALRVSMDSSLGHPGNIDFTPDSVVVRGRRGLVRALSAVNTAPVSVTVRDTTSAYVPLDTAGLDVTVLPSRVHARVHIVREPTVHDSSAGTLPPRDSIITFVDTLRIRDSLGVRDSMHVRRDSLHPRRDSLRARRDSLRRRPPTAAPGQKP